MFNIETYSKSLNEEIKAQPIFGLWSLEERDGRTTKVPYNAITNRRAKSNDSQTWTTFDNAVSGLKKYKRTGIAIFLGNGICGLDVDHIKKDIDAYKANPDDENNLINKIKRMTSDSYMEVSQSGEGIHVIFKALSKNFKNAFEHENGYELYYQKRFFALTGNLLTADESKTPEFKFLNDEQVKNLIKNTVGFRPKKVKAQTNFKDSNLSEDEIMNIILRSKQAEKFKALFTHDISYCQNHYESHSEADLALCSILAFYTRDANKIDAIFRKSKLYRDKWDKKHHGDGATYGEMTIERAIENTHNGYNMKKQRDNDINLQSLAVSASGSGQMDNVIPINGTLAKQPQGDISWRRYFIYNRTKLGDVPTIKSTAIKNALLILNYDPNFQGLFKYNRFTHDIEVAEDKKIDLNKYGSGVINFPKGSLQDIDTTNFGIYCESCYEVTFKPALIESAIEASARQHSYNPIVDYMNNAKKKWDGKQRLDELFPTFLGAEDNKTTKLITELWFMGGVAKAYNPLTKIDTWLDLSGGQGAGKTTLLQKIAPMGMYTDQFSQFEDKDAMGRMVRAFIINDDEMDASLKCGFAEVKKFTTAIYLQFRPVYMKHDVRVPKGFIMARTTNDEAHLRDATGDRRFMTIHVNGRKQKEKPFNLTPEYVQQLWGEAVHLYESFKASGKNPFVLTSESEKLLQDNREQFKQTTGLQDDIENAINDQFAYTKVAGTKQNYIIPTALSQCVFNDETYLSKHRNISSEVNRIMEVLGYKKLPAKVGGKTVRCFVYTTD